MQKRLAAFVVGVLLTLSTRVAADPVDKPPPTVPAQIKSASVLTTAKTRIELPPLWWILPPDKYPAMDAELKRAQEAETRLTAENGSLRSSAAKTDVNLIALTIAVVVGAIGGAYGWSRL